MQPKLALRWLCRFRARGRVDRRFALRLAVAAGLVWLPLASLSARQQPQGGGAGSPVTVRTVPTPPAYISGGDALVRLDAPGGVDLARVGVSVNGQDARMAFRPAPADWLGRPQNSLLGLIRGLREGDNEVAVTLDGQRVTSLTVTNYPITGPIFSGPHLEPYFCIDQLQGAAGQARGFAIGNGETLTGPPLDRNCSFATRVDFVYRQRGDGAARFLPLADPARLPDDVATVTTASGATLPFVVRLETGTINRAIYQTAVVVDPARPTPDPWTPPAGWNGRLVYTFGGGCEAGFFQATSTGGVLRDDLLSRGYAVASSTLNVNSQGGCNDPLSAETAMMVKERFAEAYGPPLHTIGWGGSGGAMQQLLIAGAYPGILDGILPTATFPDAVSYFIDSSDCYPLREYLNSRELDEDSKRAIGGWATWATCDRSLGGRPNRISPGDCPSVIPTAARYDAASNPRGVRCSIYDGMRNVFGTRVYDEVRPPAGVAFGRSPHGNVGVQYGLEALKTGRISKDVFLELNENIGGWDIDFGRTAGRTRGDPQAVRIAYETGRVTGGFGGLAYTPIIEERSYTDPSGDFHTSYYSFATRERLVRDVGHADNYVMQRRSGSGSQGLRNLELMDRWLVNLARDPSNDPPPVKVVRAKPAELVDMCLDAQGNALAERQSFDPSRSVLDQTQGRCNTLYPINVGPRLVAGGPITNDVLQCQLVPPNRASYGIAFTDAEWQRLLRIFPEGVCDYSRPGVNQVRQVGVWLSYGPSPVNRYTPPSAAGAAR